MANISFRKRLRYARVHNAMTQAELGEKMGVSQALIAQWENGKSVPSKQQKEKLKRYSVVGLRRNQQTGEALGQQSPLGLSARG
jgi:transcriptional regulator with XRE-family HTH domain